MSQLLLIGSIELDFTPVFHHNIIIRDKSNFIMDTMKCKPEESAKIFSDINIKWKEAEIKEKEK